MSMEKNWLIRTKSNHILGPVSKEKVNELYKNGSIKGDDEVCSGNGYWFFIREDDLVARYLIGNEVQGFNPISEAKDVITASDNDSHEIHSNDITMVGGINLSALSEKQETKPPEDNGIVDVELNASELAVTGVKKKNNSRPRVKAHSSAAAHPIRKQNYLKYIGILGFLFLFLLIYFRKTIIKSVFQGEMTSISLIGSAHAQENLSEKKKLLDSSISIDKVNFAISTGLDGFKVVSSLNIEELVCSDLNNHVYQLGIILYPPEVVNEKFLIKLRDCFLNLPDQHPVKTWMKWMSQRHTLSKKHQDIQKTLTDLLNSQFNLITDGKLKGQIIDIIFEIPEETLPEKILKSYLYLIIGNISRSDNILRSIIQVSPRENWSKVKTSNHFYHELASEMMPQLFKRLSKHPADRRSFELLTLYFLNFYNEPSLIQLAGTIDTTEVRASMRLAYTEKLAPSLVHYLRLTSLSNSALLTALRNFKEYPLQEQSYWFWPFINIDPLISEAMNPELLRIENEDQLWFIFLLDNERLADSFSKKHGKSFLPSRRPYLKSSLDRPSDFMMALYKLIELGDINQELIDKTNSFVTHE